MRISGRNSPPRPPPRSGPSGARNARVVPRPSCRAEAARSTSRPARPPHEVGSDRIHWNSSFTYPFRQAMDQFSTLIPVGSELGHLLARTEDYQLSHLDAVDSRAAPQVVQGALNIGSLCYGMAAAARRHGCSVTPVCTAAVLPQFGRSQGSRFSCRPSVLNSLPTDLGDVGSQVAQGLLAALDRVVRLDRLVAQLLGGTPCASRSGSPCRRART